MDLRTQRPDGEYWNFSRAEDRAMALKLIEQEDPDWIIGIPPCTCFSCWQNINFRDLSDEEKDARMAEGRQHLKFVVKIYKQRHEAGKYFLHEHPSGATSWREPCIENLL